MNYNIRSQEKKIVAIVVCSGFQLLDMAGPLEIFNSASNLMAAKYGTLLRTGMPVVSYKKNYPQIRVQNNPFFVRDNNMKSFKLFI